MPDIIIPLVVWITLAVAYSLSALMLVDLIWHIKWIFPVVAIMTLFGLPLLGLWMLIEGFLWCAIALFCACIVGWVVHIYSILKQRKRKNV